MKVISCGILKKTDKSDNELFRVRIMTFLVSNQLHTVCLENGIIGSGKTENDAMQDLIVLMEDDLALRGSGKYNIETQVASDEFRMAYARAHKEIKRPVPSVPKIDMNSLAQKLKGNINPKNPKNYFVQQRVA